LKRKVCARQKYLKLHFYYLLFHYLFFAFFHSIK
jgi:hypothetical protein